MKSSVARRDSRLGQYEDKFQKPRTKGHWMKNSTPSNQDLNTNRKS